MSLRKFFLEYRSEVVFGSILTIVALVSYLLAPLIPLDIYRSIIYPTQVTALITVLAINTWAMIRHSDGIRVRYVYAWIMGTLLVLMVTGAFYRMLTHSDLQAAEGIFGFEGWEMVGGDLIAWLLLAYPSELVRPGWLTWKNALKRILPVIILGVIDRYFSCDLRWLLALVPLVWVGLLFKHLYDYRKYCEANFGSVEQTDEQWVIRYLVMLLILGASYSYLCFSSEPTRLFTQHWLLFFVFVYTNDQVIFRSKPWIEDAANEMSEEEPEGPEAETLEANVEYRQTLERWMEAEKPYLNPEFRLLDLRQVLPLNRTYLSQLINNEYGCNFYQFVTNYRIEEAKRLMREHPDMKFQEIAEQCGFSSPTVFSRIFAREVGMSPREWNTSKP
jgi:AraC-like DNA-binding protein